MAVAYNRESGRNNARDDESDFFPDDIPQGYTGGGWDGPDAQSRADAGDEDRDRAGRRYRSVADVYVRPRCMYCGFGLKWHDDGRCPTVERIIR